MLIEIRLQISGAKVLAIDNKDPWVAVDANAEVAGSYQSFGMRLRRAF
jgi:hypothetical protein